MKSRTRTKWLKNGVWRGVWGPRWNHLPPPPPRPLWLRRPFALVFYSSVMCSKQRACIRRKGVSAEGGGADWINVWQLNGAPPSRVQNSWIRMSKGKTGGGRAPRGAGGGGGGGGGGWGRGWGEDGGLRRGISIVLSYIFLPVCNCWCVRAHALPVVWSVWVFMYFTHTAYFLTSASGSCLCCFPAVPLLFSVFFSVRGEHFLKCFYCQSFSQMFLLWLKSLLLICFPARLYLELIHCTKKYEIFWHAICCTLWFSSQLQENELHHPGRNHACWKL